MRLFFRMEELSFRVSSEDFEGFSIPKILLRHADASNGGIESYNGIYYTALNNILC
jgi:hypothetical protein